MIYKRIILYRITSIKYKIKVYIILIKSNNFIYQNHTFNSKIINTMMKINESMINHLFKIKKPEINNFSLKIQWIHNRFHLFQVIVIINQLKNKNKR